MERQQAQKRIERIDAFLAELNQLDSDGVLTLSQDQRKVIADHYDTVRKQLMRDFDVDTTDTAVQLSLAMKIASALGGFAFCIALGLFVQRYWGAMDTWLQVVLLIAAPIAAIALAEFASRRERTLYFTSLLCLVALAAFVVDLIELGTIFSLTPSPGAMAAWCALALYFAWRYRLNLQLSIGLVLLLLQVPMWIFYLSGYSWTNPFQRAEILIVAGLLLGVWAMKQQGSVASTARGIALAAVLISLLTLSKWGAGSLLPLGEKTVEGIYTILCFAISGGAIALGIQRHWDETMILASVCFGGFLMVKMYDWLWDSIPAFAFFALIGLLSLALLYAFRLLRETAKEQIA